MNSVTKVLLDTYAKAAAKEAETLTANIRNYARQSGWPVAIAMQLSVSNDRSDGKWSVKYPKAIDGQVIDLEYGTDSTPPNPVIRDFIREMQPDLGNEWVDKLIEVGIM